MSRGYKVGIALFVVAATRCFGCTYATPKVHAPERSAQLSKHRLELTEVTVVNNGVEVPKEIAAYVHEATQEILEDAAPPHPGSRAAKMSVHVDLKDEQNYPAIVGAHDGCGAVPLLVAAPAGVKLESAKLSVDVAVETDGKRLRGHGEAEKEGSLYVDARRRALAVALDRALADATKGG
ncbi:MAG: hypothetical protein KC776_03635 [Myxococcales bacterium]|nr:hypothetical protein [Myxococcales bacterium]MCB9581287.1 hypothetical protein [Polyangiaceae bacterium]